MNKPRLIWPALIGGLLCATLLVWHISLVRAQVTNTSGLTLSPPTFELTANPGQTLRNTIRLENRNDHEVKIVLDKRNFTAVGEEGAVGLTDEETGFSLASWLNVDQSEAVIPANGSRTYTFTLNVPLSVEPGGHFGSLIFRTIPTGTLTGSGASLAQELGALILVKVAGATTEAASLESFRPTKSFSEYGPITFETRVKNEGNVHLRPTGTITITNMLGHKVATLPLEGKNVLPDSVRRLDTTWDTKWRLGRYTVTVVMIYGRDNTQAAAVTSLVIVPYRVVAVALLGLILVYYLLRRSRKRWLAALRILFTGHA